MPNTPDKKTLKKQAEKEGIFNDAHEIVQAFGLHDYSATDAKKISITSVYDDTKSDRTPLMLQNVYTQWEEKDANGLLRVNSSDSLVITYKGQEVFRANGPRAADIQTYVPGGWEIDLYFMKQDVGWARLEAGHRLTDAFAAAQKKQAAEKAKQPKNPQNPKNKGPKSPKGPQSPKGPAP